MLSLSIQTSSKTTQYFSLTYKLFNEYQLSNIEDVRVLMKEEIEFMLSLQFFKRLVGTGKVLGKYRVSTVQVPGWYWIDINDTSVIVVASASMLPIQFVATPIYFTIIKREKNKCSSVLHFQLDALKRSKQQANLPSFSHHRNSFRTFDIFKSHYFALEMTSFLPSHCTYIVQKRRNDYYSVKKLVYTISLVRNTS